MSWLFGFNLQKCKDADQGLSALSYYEQQFWFLASNPNKELFLFFFWCLYQSSIRQECAGLKILTGFGHSSLFCSSLFQVNWSIRCEQEWRVTEYNYSFWGTWVFPFYATLFTMPIFHNKTKMRSNPLNKYKLLHQNFIFYH